jgi:hypothetical protein
VFHVKGATADKVRNILFENVHRASELHTHESKLCTGVGKAYASHKTVWHGWNQGGY